MNIKLYSYWRSSASYRVRIALNLKQLEYEYVPVHLVNSGGEQKGDAYKGLNPSMLVPTFVDENEDVILNQSLAIIEYLDEKYPSESPFLPQHSLDRARIRMIAQDVCCDIQPVSNLRVLNKLKSEFNANGDAVTKWSHDVIHAGFEAIESRLGTRAGKYAYGYDVTLADICIVPQVYNALRFEVDMSKFPTIHKVYNNCQKLPAFIDAAPQNQLDAP
ncbi:maleylacetoacetate isomerase [Glaciecola punicea ACAM 611]|jgi:maleylacetoacetate isomerase|uniref:Maleylacetoacetate isomerase n=1 Tax=Glaciecola punicea ACAM 611 TaxID=1121923 RepID=H5TBB4_9ALTE|nr:maleylacetoacetate isomerase [Glaciecola punicea]OFA30052.1 maleylacetoacetate isomerase [Glaciecola punicea]GAB55591.1 maleylacetoacetate isomerase [Glaciecola punicea ACAM 611]